VRRRFAGDVSCPATVCFSKSHFFSTAPRFLGALAGMLDPFLSFRNPRRGLLTCLSRAARSRFFFNLLVGTSAVSGGFSSRRSLPRSRAAPVRRVLMALLLLSTRRNGKFSLPLQEL